jgi:hypothetical protein
VPLQLRSAWLFGAVLPSRSAWPNQVNEVIAARAIKSRMRY